MNNDLRQEFAIYPAIHLKNGRSIDFTFREDNLEPVLELPDPLESAKFWIKQGASWLHVMNVDAAFDEEASHSWALVEQLCQLPVRIQYSGGIRTEADISWAIEKGVDRLLVNAAAIETPELIADAIANHGPERIALAINTNPHGKVVTRGWQEAGGVEAVVLCIQMKQLGVMTVVHTRVMEDGTMTGVDLDVSSQLAQLTGLDVVVGGEIRSMDDVLDCYNQNGITGILMGKALHSGEIDLADALNETAQQLTFEASIPKWKQDQLSVKAKARYELTRKRLLENFEPQAGQRVLDAGGGNGLDSLFLAGLDLQVDLVDRSSAMLHDFENLNDEYRLQRPVTVHQQDLRRLRHLFPEEVFDLALCHNVIQYTAHWEAVIAAITRTLKPGGLLSLVTRNHHAAPYTADIMGLPESELTAMLDSHIGHSSVFDSDLTLFSPEYLTGWFQRNGFEVLADYGVFCLHAHPAINDVQDEDSLLLSRIVTLDTAMGDRSPHKQTARYLQFILRRC